jgi:ketosteroid isomerase-like protein
VSPQTAPAERPDNVARLREGFDAMNAGDEQRILAFAHPDFEMVVPPELSAEPDTYRGHEGIRRYFELFDDAMEGVRFEAERLWEAGDAVVALVKLTARGKQTGIPVEQRLAQVWTMREGRALRAQPFPTLAEALAAAGLDPAQLREDREPSSGA